MIVSCATHPTILERGARFQRARFECRDGALVQEYWSRYPRHVLRMFHEEPGSVGERGTERCNGLDDA